MAEYISPRTGKVVLGVTLCSHAELQQYHYAALNNPAYRQELWQMWHEVEHEPSNYASLTSPPKRGEQVFRYNVGDLVPIRGLLVDLQGRLNRHIDTSKKKPDQIDASKKNIGEDQI